MSFFATFNSLSKNGVTSAVNGYGITSNVSGSSSGFGVTCCISNDGNHVAVAQDGPNVRLFFYQNDSGTLKLLNSIATSVLTPIVSINTDGSYLIAGAPSAQGSRGYVQIFNRTGNTWALQQQINPTINQVSSQFGEGVSIDDTGTRVAIGQPTVNQGNVTSRGAVFVYTRTGTTWSLEQQIDPIISTNVAQFGRSVALNGNGDKLFIGSPGANNSTGQFYYYTRSGNTWTQQNIYIASDAANNSSFGNTIISTIDANTIFVSAPRKEVAGNVDVGSVYKFNSNGSSYTEVDIIYPTANANFALMAQQDNRMTTNDNANVFVFSEEIPIGASNTVIKLYQNNNYTFSQILGNGTNYTGYGMGMSGTGQWLIVSTYGSNIAELYSI